MGDAKVKERVRAKLACEINSAELGCRIFEHMSGQVGLRPFPGSPEKSLDVIRQEDPVIFARLMAATKAAVEYIHECINAGQVPS